MKLLQFIKSVLLKLLAVGIILMLTLSGGCGVISSNNSQKEEILEEVFDPLIYPDDIDLDKELFSLDNGESSSGYIYTPEIDTLRNAAESADTSVTESSSDLTMEPIWVYQIEVFSSGSRQEVIKKKEEIQRRIELPVSIIFEAPFYRIRVGNLPSIQEAEDLRNKFKRMGFKSAFWVRTSVEIKKE